MTRLRASIPAAGSCTALAQVGPRGITGLSLIYEIVPTGIGRARGACGGCGGTGQGCCGREGQGTRVEEGRVSGCGDGGGGARGGGGGCGGCGGCGGTESSQPDFDIGDVTVRDNRGWVRRHETRSITDILRDVSLALDIGGQPTQATSRTGSVAHLTLRSVDCRSRSNGQGLEGNRSLGAWSATTSQELDLPFEGMGVDENGHTLLPVPQRESLGLDPTLQAVLPCQSGIGAADTHGTTHGTLDWIDLDLKITQDRTHGTPDIHAPLVLGGGMGWGELEDTREDGQQETHGTQHRRSISK